ncbi:hypothetical protein JOC76_005302 [Neobacillus cucumis]|nr:hypothetical protein [Neobacillus cucumis]
MIEKVAELNNLPKDTEGEEVFKYINKEGNTKEDSAHSFF